MGTDATKCAVCGGEFGTKRIHIEGKQYHPGCAVMSYPPHTHDDWQRLADKSERLRAALTAIKEGYGPNHGSKFCWKMACSVLDK